MYLPQFKKMGANTFEIVKENKYLGIFSTQKIN